MIVEFILILGLCGSLFFAGVLIGIDWADRNPRGWN